MSHEPAYNKDIMSEIPKCTSLAMLSIWMDTNKGRIEKMPEAEKAKVRNLCRQYVDIFKKEVKDERN